MNKKNEDVFTIKFDKRLPKHRQAVAILNGVGRKKSFIIAEALDIYIKKSGLFDEVIIPKVRTNKKTPVLENFDVKPDVLKHEEVVYEPNSEERKPSSPQKNIVQDKFDEENFDVSDYEENYNSKITSEDVSSIMEAIQGFDNFE